MPCFVNAKVQLMSAACCVFLDVQHGLHRAVQKFVCEPGLGLQLVRLQQALSSNLGLRPSASCLREAGSGWELASVGEPH